MATETLVLATTSGPTPARSARPNGAVDGRVLGGVVVVHEAFGLTDYIADVCGRFAAAGWHAIAPDLYHRVGSPVLDYTDLPGATAAARTLTSMDILDDLDAGLKWLADTGTAVDRCAVVGFCLGGSVALAAAAHFPLGAAVTFYGGGIVEGRFGEQPGLELARRLQTPWLGLFGDQDARIPVDEVEALRVAAATAQVPTEVVRYPDAGHGFHCDARPSAYRQRAARDAWSRTLTWLEAHITD
jgi:carboxymethylenebutenolidase